jgi:TonB family protein
MTIRLLLAAPAALALTACATTGTTLAPSEHPSGIVHLSLAPASDHARAFPALADTPTLPGVDPIGLHVEKTLGADPRATVGICVGPTGAVDDVRVLRGSGMAAFDHAVEHDVRAWRFAAPAPGAPACQAATIVYRLR